MKVNEISANNRIELEYISELNKQSYYKGIVLSISETTLKLVTDYGELEELDVNKIIYVDKVSFSRDISEALTNARSYYLEMDNIKTRLKELEVEKPNIYKNIQESKFLSKYNDTGAINILNEMLDSVGSIVIDNTVFSFRFSEGEEEGQLFFYVEGIRKFEYFDTNDEDELLRAKERYAPNRKAEISGIFSSVNDIIRKKTYLEREKDYLFKAVSLYEGIIDVDKKNFLEVKSTILETIKNKINEEVKEDE